LFSAPKKKQEKKKRTVWQADTKFVMECRRCASALERLPTVLLYECFAFLSVADHFALALGCTRFLPASWHRKAALREVTVSLDARRSRLTRCTGCAQRSCAFRVLFGERARSTCRTLPP
jgi:hypothetical protein